MAILDKLDLVVGSNPWTIYDPTASSFLRPLISMFNFVYMTSIVYTLVQDPLKTFQSGVSERRLIVSVAVGFVGAMVYSVTPYFSNGLVARLPVMTFFNIALPLGFLYYVVVNMKDAFSNPSLIGLEESETENNL